MNKTNVAVGLAIAGILMGGVADYAALKKTPQTTYGTTANQRFAQLQPYALYGAGAVTGATSITLKSMKDIDGNALTMSGTFGTKGFGTLEPNNGTQEEQISFTGLVNNSNGTVTLTGVSNVSFTYPYTETSGLSKTHPGSATFVISNTSGFYNELTSQKNDATISGVYTFGSTTQPTYDANPVSWTSQNSLINKAYADALSIQGSATSTEANMGIVQLATAAQVGVGTASSSAGAPLVIENKFATTTPGTLCTGSTWNCIVATVAGKIAQSFLDLTQSFTFSGGLTSTATTTITASNVNSNAFVINGLAYAYPSTRGASSTVMKENGSGTLIWDYADFTTISIAANDTGSTSAAASTTLLSVTIPANTFTLDRILAIGGTFTYPSGSCTATIDIGNGSATTSNGFVSNTYDRITVQAFATSTSAQGFFTTVDNLTPNTIGAPSDLFKYGNYTTTGTLYVAYIGNCSSGGPIALRSHWITFMGK